MSWIRFLATGFAVGCAPFAPGTFGTLVGIPIVFAFGFLSPINGMLLTTAFVFFSIWIAELNERRSGVHDQSEVVIDEIAGYMVTMLWLPPTWQSYVAGFLLFRFFDILKPFPIGMIDKKLEGGIGVVMDDIAAGIASNIVLQVIFVQTAWLGVQWGPL